MTTKDDKRRKPARIIFRTTEELHQQLQQIAKEQRRSLSSLVDYLVSKALERKNHA